MSSWNPPGSAFGYKVIQGDLQIGNTVPLCPWPTVWNLAISARFVYLFVCLFVFSSLFFYVEFSWFWMDSNNLLIPKRKKPVYKKVRKLLNNWPLSRFENRTVIHKWITVSQFSFFRSLGWTSRIHFFFSYIGMSNFWAKAVRSCFSGQSKPGTFLRCI